MDILKTAVLWAKAEMVSSAFFAIFAIVFLAASFGFWQVGKTEVARAYVIPTAVAGVLLLILGVGLVVQSYGHTASFPKAYIADATAFVTDELTRTEAVLAQYRSAVFKVIPLSLAVCAVLFVFVTPPIWRACLVSAMSMLLVILMVDTNAIARLSDYKATLLEAQETTP